ncbi:hypothetical protein [Planotetraspora kaengkrachanensis]|uniref:Uncharacterized protein n=1 Tax=Planotetraspora kaengkrachanensis TaxID=575193 RepID=A0A8J3VC62_9ACTN|nr:hypothetical protein [Planotetraspora kaengkrachanensis]GIG84567.1 hypothetical protein Pka01_76940 [Planotetraspora kaengkrachanensis]
MVEEEGFGAVLKGLAARRHLDLVALPSIPESELQAVFHGGASSPSLLRRLAPVLGLHAADLFAIAGVGVPEDLAPVDATAGGSVPYLVREVVRLPPEKRPVLRQFVASLPEEERTHPVPKPPVREQYLAGPGALLMRMARNRNLGWTATAKTFLAVTGRYWSAATYGGVGHGRTQLTPELLADFSAVLDVPADDLAALTGVALPGAASVPKPAVAGVAELIWDVRRLTATQLRQVSDRAKSMAIGTPE